jgi:hypothetical protein
MAKNPEVDDTGALAIKPPRENIFARPRPATSTASATGPFDGAAACAPAECSGARAAALRRPGVRWSAKVTSLVAVALIVVAVARPGGDGTPAQERPRQRQTTPPVKRMTARPPIRQRVPTGRAPRDRHRKARPQRNRRTRPRTAPPRAVSPVVPAVPRRAPARPAPSRPLPAPVPAGSPPEFM